MATTADVEAALSRLRAARAKLFELTSQKDAAIARKNRDNQMATDLNAAITAQKTEVANARTAAAAILQQTEDGVV
jgi:hypothetical protein